MLRRRIIKGVLGLSAIAALFAAMAVHAQSGGGAADAVGQGTRGQSGTQTGEQGQAGGQAAGTTASGTGTASSAKLSRADRNMLMSMAQANMAEIEMGRMAQNKSQNEQVKNFAQQMIDDHSKALDDVRQLAQERGLTLSNDLDRANRAKANRLAALSGDAFDQAYMAQAGVADHKKNHSHLRSTQSRARDPELKALAARTLPIVDQHLNSAQQLHKNTARGSSGTRGTTGSSPDKSQRTPPPAQQQQQQQQQGQ